MDGNIKLRAMREEDAPALAGMEREIFSQPWSELSFRQLLEHSYSLCLVADSGGTEAGCAVMTLLGDEGDIDKVMVAEPFRGRGIGKALVEGLIREGNGRGVNAFTLEVRKSNLAAIRLYERAGFAAEGVRPRFYEKPTEDALIMWRRPTITMPGGCEL